MIHLTFFLAALLAIEAPAEPGLQADYEALYRSGRSYDTFLEQAERRRRTWIENDARAEIPADLLRRAAASGGPFYLLVVAVDGCSDSVSTIPYLARLVTGADNLEMRIVDADAGRDVMLSHRTPDGRPATPTVLVLDAAFEEIGSFIERPARLQEWALDAKESLPAEDYLEQKFAWYDEDLGRSTVEEVVAIMEYASVPDEMKGMFEDDYGSVHRIEAGTWVHGVGGDEPATFHVTEWSVDEHFAIARNAESNTYAPGLWTRIDWMTLDGIDVMQPFEWAYCLTSFEAESADAARSAAPADRTSPRTGCGGHPFTRMSPADTR